ncbi:hypothetical protein TRVL_09274 [Trypanosoma vivax]|nr:hypothetical protein TRVL_09274 [Trypanosoma vivax]
MEGHGGSFGRAQKRKYGRFFFLPGIKGWRKGFWIRGKLGIANLGRTQGKRMASLRAGIFPFRIVAGSHIKERQRVKADNGGSSNETDDLQWRMVLDAVCSCFTFVTEKERSEIEQWAAKKEKRKTRKRATAATTTTNNENHKEGF